MRSDEKSNIFEINEFKIIYRRYASLYFIIGCDLNDNNELSYLTFIHFIVELLDKYFESVCELDIMFNIEKIYYMIDEMIMDGYIME